MAYVPVPKDLSKIKTKVAFNLTKRQIICFAAALAIGLPLFFLLKDSAGTSMAAFAMIVVTDTSSRVTSSYKICKLGCCPLFSMDAIYRGAMFSLSANWLREISFAFLAALIACPKALKSNFSLLCFIIISPNYIVYFISLSRYDYTHHSMDRNRAYYVLAIIRLSEYNYIDNV